MWSVLGWEMCLIFHKHLEGLIVCSNQVEDSCAWNLVRFRIKFSKRSIDSIVLMWFLFWEKLWPMIDTVISTWWRVLRSSMTKTLFWGWLVRLDLRIVDMKIILMEFVHCIVGLRWIINYSDVMSIGGSDLENFTIQILENVKNIFKIIKRKL